MMQINNENEWRLESLTIRYNDYGDFKGKHTGKIIFQNKLSDAFTFVLTPEKTEAYMHLIKDEIVTSASALGQMLLQSLNLLPAPTQTSQIGEVIAHEEISA